MNAKRNGTTFGDSFTALSAKRHWSAIINSECRELHESEACPRFFFKGHTTISFGDSTRPLRCPQSPFNRPRI